MLRKLFCVTFRNRRSNTLRRHVPYAVMSPTPSCPTSRRAAPARRVWTRWRMLCNPNPVAIRQQLPLLVCAAKSTHKHTCTHARTHTYSLSISISPHRPGQAGPCRHSHSHPPGTQILVKRLCLFMLSFTSGFENSNNCFFAGVKDYVNLFLFKNTA